MTSSLMLPPAFPRGVFPPVPLSPCWPCLLLAMERQPVSQPQAGKPAWDKVRGRFGEKEVREEGGSDHIVYTAQKNKLGTPEGDLLFLSSFQEFHCFYEKSQGSTMYLCLLGTLSQTQVTSPCLPPLNLLPVCIPLGHYLVPLLYLIFLKHILS